MDIDKYKQGGKLLKQRGIIGEKEVEYWYFYPDPLPVGLQLPEELTKQLSNAAFLLGELKGLANMVPNINIFVSAYKRKEAVLSSRIEGTRISLTELFQAEAEDKKQENLEAREVLNYVHALNLAFEDISKGGRIEAGTLNRIHLLLLQNARGRHGTVGEFRKVQNWIGTSQDIEKAVFVPPPPGKVPELMEHLFTFMEREDNIPPLVKIALMHYYFETIHPYEDGNGRVGRTLIILYLTQLKLLDRPILYLSPFFEKNREQYYEYLRKTSQEGNYTAWLKFFLGGVEEISIETSAKIKKLLGLYKSYREKLLKLRPVPVTFIVLDKFFENPYSTIPAIQKSLKTNYNLIERSVEKLIRAGIVREVTAQKRNRLYLAQEILDVFDKNP